MARIELRDLRKVYDDVEAVQGIDLEVEDGEFLVFVGPSGCGKSTTLRMIAGLESVTDGTVRIGDRVVNDVEPKDRSIAMVFQNYALYPHMTAAENMKFGMKSVSDYSGAEIDDRVREAAGVLDIEDLLDRKPKELSGGERQRVAIGRALVREPSVFLLDEPLSNLDAKLRVQMRAELLKLHRELDATTVYVTHDQTEAMTMGDRVAVLNDGRLQQVAPPQELYDYPENEFVAGFIGEPSMNFLPVDREGDELVGDGFRYPLSAATRESVGDATDLVLGIRPEDIELRPTEAGDHAFDAVVDVVEPRGDENTVHLRFADADGDDLVTATVGGMVDVESGESVDVAVPEDAIHVFDAASGEALHNRRLERDDAVEHSPV